MSDLEDLDHGPEDIQLEEELSAPADNPAAGPRNVPKTIGRDVLLKAAAALVVVAGGGAYFMLSSHHAPSRHAEAPFAPQKQASTNSTAWNNTAPSPSATAPLSAVPPPVSKPHDLLPAAIPPAPSAAMTVTQPAVPPIVNEMPPPSAQLTNVGGAATPSPPAAPSPSVPSPSVPSGAATASIPGMPSAPSIDSSLPAQAPAAASISGMPPAPSTPSPAPSAVAGPDSAQPQLQPVTPPVVKNEENMPSVAVAPVVIDADKTGINKTDETSTPAQTAQVEELQKKIDDLEKTIVQLQQAAVVKEDTAEKSAEEAAPATSKKEHHHNRRHVAASRQAHKSTIKWVLKAAKPGIAWVAKKGSDDLQVVETGDSLTGIGKVTAIIRDSSGNWVVNGTKGRISQQ